MSSLKSLSDDDLFDEWRTAFTAYRHNVGNQRKVRPRFRNLTRELHRRGFPIGDEKTSPPKETPPKKPLKNTAS